MPGRTVLISGAGVAGCTLAYWLARHGFAVTVVERSQGLRSSGNPVDIRGPAVAVTERMGVMPQLHEAATQVRNLVFVNAAGRRVGRVNMRAFQRAAGSREVEIPRADLAAILYRAAHDSAEFLFDDTITAMLQDPDGVEVTFDRTAPCRFDLVIGADGLHSTVRRLNFGPEAGFIRHLGMYVATVPLGQASTHDRDVIMHNTPGRAVAVHPGHHNAMAAFMYRAPAVPDYNYRDTAQHKRLVAAAYAGMGWQVPELLGRVETAEDLYFDTVSQVHLPTWSDGRVTLLGDAASCVSLFSEGSSLAIAGAAALAAAIAAHPDDPQIAFRRFETEHRPLVEAKQQHVNQIAALLIPATPAAITVRNLATRLWPLAAGATWASTRIRAARHPAHHHTQDLHDTARS